MLSNSPKPASMRRNTLLNLWKNPNAGNEFVAAVAAVVVSFEEKPIIIATKVAAIIRMDVTLHNNHEPGAIMLVP